jgi:hypothetical protein
MTFNPPVELFGLDPTTLVCQIDNDTNARDTLDHLFRPSSDLLLEVADILHGFASTLLVAARTDS